MPLATLTAEQTAEAMRSGESDLKWLLSDNEVSMELQALLFHHKFNKMKVFLGLGENRAEVRETLRADFGLNPAEGIAMRQQLAMALAAWDAAKEYVSKDNTMRAEARTSHIPRPVTSNEHAAMLKAYEVRYGRLETGETPGKHYLGVKAEEIEDNEPKAESLKEVSSKDDGEDDFLLSEVGKDGNLKVRKGVRDGKMPADPEELRARLKLVANCWLFLRTKHSNREWLQDLDDKVFGKYADHLLGKFVHGATVFSHDGGSAVRPPWGLVLSYEFEMRKWAYEQVVREQITLAEAIKAASKNTELKEKYFVTPYTLGVQQGNAAGTKRTSEVAAEQDQVWDGSKKWGRKGKGRGGRKGGKGGKDKGATKKGDGKGKHSRTPDGRAICYKHNNENEKCNGQCNMLHVCQRCFDRTHKAFECPSITEGK